MHDVIIRYLEGKLSQTEKEAFFLLMKTDSKLKAEFISTQNLYALTSLLPQEFDSDFALDKLKRFKQKRNVTLLFSSLKRLTGYAAAISLIAFLTWTVTKKAASVDEQKNQIAYEEFVTPSGQRAMVKLADGTTVWLNARTTLRYPNIFSKKERRVELDGEAFFDVAPNENQPFIVSTEKLDIRVFGTTFNVFAYKNRNEFKAALVEGAITLYNSKDASTVLALKPYESVELVDEKWVKTNFHNMDFLLWKEGIYAFDDVVFSEITKKLELYYDITISVNNKKLAAYKFSGKFRQRDGVESVLRTLREVYYFSYTKDDEHNTIHIR